jgi:hypothetical protein
MVRTVRGLSPGMGDDQQMVLAHNDVVAAMQLAPAAGLGLAVDEHWPVGEERLYLAAAVDYSSELEQLPEPDGIAVNGDLAGH